MANPRTTYTIIGIIVVFVFFIQCFSLIKSIHPLINKPSKEIEQINEDSGKIETLMDLNPGCYEAKDLKTCTIFNGLLFNSSQISLNELSKFENSVKSATKKAKFYTYRFFMNTKIESDAKCSQELTNTYCETALRTQRNWLCKRENSDNLDYLTVNEQTYHNLSFFDDHFPIALESNDKYLVKYIRNLNIMESGRVNEAYYNMVSTYRKPEKELDLNIAFCHNFRLEDSTLNITERITLLHYQLRSIMRKNTILIMHVDKLLPTTIYKYIQNMVREYVEKGYKIFFMPHRYKSLWGSSSQLYIELSCLSYLMQLEQDYPFLKWDYVINLSENDFPIKPISHIQRVLHKKQSTFIEHYRGTNHDLSQRHHPRRILLDCKPHEPISADLEMETILSGHNYTKGDKYFKTSPPYFEEYYRGSPWYIMHRTHALSLIRQLKFEDLMKVKYTFGPEETFIHTMLLKSRLPYPIHKFNQRLEGADPGPLCSTCQDLFERHWPILKSSKSLFARKVVSVELAKQIMDYVVVKDYQ